MTARKRSIVTTSVYRHSGVVRGPVRVVHPAIQRLGLPWQFDHRRGGWLIPKQHLADLEAALVADGHVVQLREET